MPSGQFVTHTWHVPGTLAANLSIRLKMAFDAQLIHVSTVGSNAYAAGLQIGNGTTAEAYMVKKSIGVSGTPVVFDLDDFVDAATKTYPRLTKGNILALALDYDYNGGGSAQASADVTIVAAMIAG